MAADSVMPTGFARFVPARRGAVPCVASNTAADSPTCPPGATPSPPIRPGRHVGHDVAVEVRQHQDVESLGRLDELHAEGVDDPVLERDLRVARRPPAGRPPGTARR